MKLATPSSSDDLTVFVITEDSDLCDTLTLALGYRGFGLRRYSSRRDFLADWRPAWQGCVLSNVDQHDDSALDLLPASHSLRHDSAAKKPALASGLHDLPVILLVDTLDGAFVRRAFLAGAVDVLPTPLDVDQLLPAISHAMATTEARREKRVAGGKQQVRIAHLTPRESEVATLVRQGHDNHRVGDRLGISHRTVEVHKTRLMRKLGIRSLAELISLPLTTPSRPRSRQTIEAFPS